MTKRKTDATDDLSERIERKTIDWLKATPTEDWVTMTRTSSRWLPALSPTAQRRILQTMLEVTRTRYLRMRRRARKRVLRQLTRLTLSETWPAELVEWFARLAIPHLKVSEEPRARIHNRDAFRKAAEYRAHHQEASWNELADAVGVSQSTVRQWDKLPEFARYVADARFNIRQEKLRVWGRWLGEQIKKSHRR